MSINKNNLAQQYAHRKARNLAYFQRHHPAIYNRFHSFLMRRVEVAISPVEQDIDVLVEGVSQYQGHAAAWCRVESNHFLKHHQKAGSIKSITPPWQGAYKGGGFAESRFNEMIQKSPLTPDEFSGYTLSEGFFPQIVFLGCGAGFQIQQTLEKVSAINVVVFEPDPELFAASLFCVDWDTIGAKINTNRGESLVFLIGEDDGMSDDQQVGLLRACLYPSAPFYPYMTVFFNHRNSPSMVRVADELSKGIHKFRLSWLDYDDTLRRANNCLHNLMASPAILRNTALEKAGKNVLIVGSGPSIDDRFAEIKAYRNQFVLVSAGTGVKGLLENGLVPDFHVELDPDYLIYDSLNVSGKERLTNTVLIAINEINPLVVKLFSRVVLYFKTENPTTDFFDSKQQSFENCNPTCTNAAASIFTALGFENLFLFGCDFGYKHFDQHHSSHSIYGAGDSDIFQDLKIDAESRFSNKNSFKVPGVNNTEVYTRTDYFVAKQEMEVLIASKAKLDQPPRYFNCSDGADIKGAEWLGSVNFSAMMAKEAAILDSMTLLQDAVCEHSFVYPGGCIDEQVAQLISGAQNHLQAVRKIFYDNKRLRGQKDLARTIHSIARYNRYVRQRNGQAVSVEQFYGQYIVAGAILSFLMIGITHGMALSDKSKIRTFLTEWSKAFDKFLLDLSSDVHAVLSRQLPAHEDPWVLNSLKWIRSAGKVSGPAEDIGG